VLAHPVDFLIELDAQLSCTLLQHDSSPLLRRLLGKSEDVHVVIPVERRETGKRIAIGNRVAIGKMELSQCRRCVRLQHLTLRQIDHHNHGVLQAFIGRLSQQVTHRIVAAREITNLNFRHSIANCNAQRL
jgi:hypothetical protein